MTRPRPARLETMVITLIAFTTAGCGATAKGTRCGIASVAGPTMLLEEFTKPGKTLSAIPASMPEVLPVRMAAGAVQRGLVGKTDTSWVVGVDGPMPATPVAGFGVLLVDPVKGPDGVLLYEGLPIRGAPILGTVHIGALVVPLIGLATQVVAFQDAGCPLFPDSLRR